MACLFLSLTTYLSNIVVSTIILYKHRVQSQEIIGHIKQNSHVTSGIHDFVKCCIKRWVHLDLQPDMLLGGLQPTRYILHAPSN